MSEFENYREIAARISHEIDRNLVALGIDINDEAAIRELAREALLPKGEVRQRRPDEDPWLYKARVELHGLIGLMLQTMKESAEIGYQVHGSDSWKALARALWAEREGQPGSTVSRGTE